MTTDTAVNRAETVGVAAAKTPTTISTSIYKYFVNERDTEVTAVSKDKVNSWNPDAAIEIN